MDQEVETPVEDGDPEVVQDELDGTSQTEDDLPEGEGDEAEATLDDVGDDGGVTISIGDDEPETEPELPKEAPQWLRTLRKDYQKVVREARELRAENERLKVTSAPAAIVVGDKPTMEACGFDEEKFEAELDAWKDRKRTAEAQARDQEQAQAKEREAWDARVVKYQTAKAKLPVKDFADAEAAVMATFDATQQGILLLTDQPEVMMYALGKNDKERARLAGLKNYGEFAIQVGKIMANLKVTPRKSAPPPERRLSGSAPGSRGTGGADKELARLEAEADRTGDRTKVAAHRRKMASAGA